MHRRQPAPVSGQPGHLVVKPHSGVLVYPKPTATPERMLPMPRSAHNGCSPNARGARLRLESLEDRTLLSASPVVSLDGLKVGTGYASDHILVRYREGAAPSALPGTSLGDEVGLVANLYRVDLSPQVTVDAALAAYRADEGVAAAEADRYLGVSATPN